MSSIKEVTPVEVEEIIANNKDTVIIDVREDEEVANGMIHDALHIPLQQIPEKLTNLNKEKEYILVCRSGGRSMKAALYMEEEGFKVANMVGGMLEWTDEIVFK